MLICPPGVYRPQADTRLLTRALTEAKVARHSRVLDVCTGTGALALAAARAGAVSVTAVDISRGALFSAWVNSRLRRMDIALIHGDFRNVLLGRRFDIVLANPPYVPTGRSDVPRGADRSWDAGPDGRSAIDSLCRIAPELLSRTGFMLMVHSALCGVDDSLTRLRASGLKAAVVARAVIPFGPVLRSRAAWLTARGFIQPGQLDEELVVIRADRPRN
ncbi:methyltransferase [Nocardia sp. 2]|uniref:Methyltransferase n=1 Tax=Nocardia acididurans TaxID=2802282 RepID=A0ABS1M8I8_9NOCA|nr:HemK2/MTQ2 family protein methyltransferase [Nocardia acididurans]MBL1076874.1 methyltransferase [Nocardia acididurans]